MPSCLHTHRQSSRHAVEADCDVRSESDGRLLGRRLVDLSYHGARVAAEPGARVGERVRLRLRVPGSSHFIGAGGYVARLIPGQRAQDPGPSLGVRIDRMNGMDRVFLASVIRAFPPPPPTRGTSRDYAREVARIREGS